MTSGVFDEDFTVSEPGRPERVCEVPARLSRNSNAVGQGSPELRDACSGLLALAQPVGLGFARQVKGAAAGGAVYGTELFVADNFDGVMAMGAADVHKAAPSIRPIVAGRFGELYVEMLADATSSVERFSSNNGNRFFERPIKTTHFRFEPEFDAS